MVDQDVLAVEDREDAGTLVAFHRGEGRRDERRPRSVVEIGAVEAVHGPEATEAEGAGEPVDVVGAEPQLLAPLQAMRAQLEKRLDSALPFDDATRGALRAIVDWLPIAVAAASARTRRRGLEEAQGERYRRSSWRALA